MDLHALLTEFGAVNGLLIIGILLLYAVARSLHRRVLAQHAEQLQDRQREIDRLARDNHEYRERFLALLDKKFPNEVNMT